MSGGYSDRMLHPLVPFAELHADPSEPAELGALRRLSAAGFRVAPLRVVPAAAEETFYRLNNLPAQLSALFSGLDLGDPDEDDLEERTPAAQRLVRAHFLLDEFVDLFYAGLTGLPAQLRVRRAYSPDLAPDTKAGRVVTRGRPALLALKETWADDWSYDALWARTTTDASVALIARPVLLTSTAQERLSDAETARAESILGARVQLSADPKLGLTGVQFL